MGRRGRQIAPVLVSPEGEGEAGDLLSSLLSGSDLRDPHALLSVVRVPEGGYCASTRDHWIAAAERLVALGATRQQTIDYLGLSPPLVDQLVRAVYARWAVLMPAGAREVARRRLLVAVQEIQALALAIAASAAQQGDAQGGAAGLRVALAAVTQTARLVGLGDAPPDAPPPAAPDAPGPAAGLPAEVVKQIADLLAPHLGAG